MTPDEHHYHLAAMVDKRERSAWEQREREMLRALFSSLERPLPPPRPRQPDYGFIAQCILVNLVAPAVVYTAAVALLYFVTRNP